MDNLAFVRRLEEELKMRRIPKEQFYRDSGISSATMSQWRKGIYAPSAAAVRKIEQYLGITFSLQQTQDDVPRPVTDRELKFALWGDASQIDDEDLEDVRRYAEFIRQRKQKK